MHLQEGEAILEFVGGTTKILTADKVVLVKAEER